jgi:hypothetical protein
VVPFFPSPNLSYKEGHCPAAGALGKIREQTTPTERSLLVGEVSAKFADRGSRVISATESHGHILGFLDRSRYYFFEIAPQLYSRGLSVNVGTNFADKRR